MKSTVGRPRRVTDSQVAEILEWHARLLALKAKRAEIKTTRELAHELHVSTGAIWHVVATAGRYKQPSPEHREKVQRERRALMRKLTGDRRQY